VCVLKIEVSCLQTKVVRFDIFLCPTETLVGDSGIFNDRNFSISNPYEVSNEVLVERKPEKFSKFWAKINYCVHLNFYLPHRNMESIGFVPKNLFFCRFSCLYFFNIFLSEKLISVRHAPLLL
jgi:hypothetical protein